MFCFYKWCCLCATRQIYNCKKIEQVYLALFLFNKNLIQKFDLSCDWRRRRDSVQWRNHKLASECSHSMRASLFEYDCPSNQCAIAHTLLLLTKKTHLCVQFLAETERFELSCRLLDKRISSASRYDHFGTSPKYENILAFLYLFVKILSSIKEKTH